MGRVRLSLYGYHEKERIDTSSAGCQIVQQQEEDEAEAEAEAEETGGQGGWARWAGPGRQAHRCARIRKKTPKISHRPIFFMIHVFQRLDHWMMVRIRSMS